MKIGITGQEGFVGQHLYNTLGLFPEEFERVEYKPGIFEDQTVLNNFVSNCDVIVHLAALNRHNDPQVIYDVNIGLVKKLLTALEFTNSMFCFLPPPRKNGITYMGKAKKKAGSFLPSGRGNQTVNSPVW